MITRQLRPCPDCSATIVDNRLVHDSTCPLGTATDQRMAADRRWFEDHPRAQRFTRPITGVEVDELKAAGEIPEGWDASGTVVVTQLAPGVRTRNFSDIRMAPREFGGARDRAFEAECVRLADEALASGEVATNGDLIAVPDIALAGFVANGHDVPSPWVNSFALQLADGRKVDFFRRPPEWSA
jgi:hypothetical protein